MAAQAELTGTDSDQTVIEFEQDIEDMFCGARAVLYSGLERLLPLLHWRPRVAIGEMAKPPSIAANVQTSNF